MNSESVPLSKLVHDITQDAYKDLRATIDSAGDADDDSRRFKILDYAMRTRHRLARLLTAVQWWSDYSAFHHSATTARDASIERATAFSNAADALWSSAHLSRAASAAAPALSAAAHILGGQETFGPLPKLIESAAGVDTARFDPELDVDLFEAEAVVRLGASTRNFIRLVVPDGCKVLSWRVPPGDAAVRIGIPGVWSADLLLDRLSEEGATLRLLRVGVQVASDLDALGTMRKNVRSAFSSQSSAAPRVVFSVEQEEPLREMIQDRMHWAVVELEKETAEKVGPPRDGEVAAESASAVLPGNVPEPPPADKPAFSGAGDVPVGGSGVSHVARAECMLSVLCDVMSTEVAAAFSLDHVRSQASALVNHRAWRQAGIGTEGISGRAAGDTPVRVKYWGASLCPSELEVLPSRGVLGPTHGGVAPNLDTCVLRVRHEPLVQGVSLPQLSLSSINVEELLLLSCKARARQMLLDVALHCKELTESFSISEASLEGKCSTLVHLFLALPYGGGVEVIVDLRTGAWRMRACGCTHLAQALLGSEKMGWTGWVQFPTLDAAKTAVKDSVLHSAKLSESHLLLRWGIASDIPGLSQFPPGVASVEDATLRARMFADLQSDDALGSFVPPLVAVERIAPKVFLTLSSFDPDVSASIVEPPAVSENGSTAANGSLSAKSECVPANSATSDVATGNLKSDSATKPFVAKPEASDRVVPKTAAASTTSADGSEKKVPTSAPLAPVPSTQNPTRVRSLKRLATQDGVVFVQGKRRRTALPVAEPGSSREQSSMCRVSGAVGSLWADVNATIRRDRLLQAFFDRGMIDGVLEDDDTQGRCLKDRSSPASPSPLRTSLQIVAEPIPVIAAELRLYGDDSWQLHLTLLTDVFDDYGDDGRPAGAAYASSRKELSFRYQVIDEVSVNRCRLDLLRARTAAVLMQGLAERSSSVYEIEKRTPWWVHTSVAGLQIVVGLMGEDGFSVQLSPRRPDSVGLNQVAYHMEEVLNASIDMSAGRVLAGLLEYAGPLVGAIVTAVPSEANVCRVAYSMCMRARILLLGKNKSVYAVEMDSRSERGVIVYDCARALQAKGQVDASRRKYNPVVGWDGFVAKLVEDKVGKAAAAGAAVIIPMSKLPVVLATLVGKITTERLGNGSAA